MDDRGNSGVTFVAGVFSLTRHTAPVFMGFHILRVTHAIRSFFSSLPPEASTRRIVPVFEKRRARPLSFQSHRWIPSNPAAFTVPLLSSSPVLSQLHPDPGCIGIPTQRSDRSALGCFHRRVSRTMRFSSRRRRRRRRRVAFISRAESSIPS